MSDLVVEVTDANFQESVLNHSKPVLVYFWASWSGPCQTMASTISDMALEYGEQMAFVSCNHDTEPETIQRYGVESLPTLILFNHGEPVVMMEDTVSRQVLAEKILKVLGEG